MKNSSKKEQSRKQFFALSKERIISAAKKIMMAGIIIGVMNIPSNALAQNRGEKGNNKQHVQVAKKRGLHKEVVGKQQHKPKNKMNHNAIHHNHIVKRNHAPIVVHAPAPRPVVIHHKPAPRPVIVHHCDNNLAEAAAVAIGVAGLISLLAN